MPACSFRNCRNYDGKANKTLQGISYHIFPANGIRRRTWTAVVRKQRREEDWIPLKNSRICSNHFKSEDKYISEKGLLLLKNYAVPLIQTIQDPWSPPTVCLTLREPESGIVATPIPYINKM